MLLICQAISHSIRYTTDTNLQCRAIRNQRKKISCHDLISLCHRWLNIFINRMIMTTDCINIFHVNAMFPSTHLLLAIVNLNNDLINNICHLSIPGYACTSVVHIAFFIWFCHFTDHHIRLVNFTDRLI